jgi:glucosamine--fructose-6-phosphate aminotransferase (isomerizing)
LIDLRQALVVGISRSGEGTDVNLVLMSARRQGAYTLGITNEAHSSMAELVDEVFLVHAGRQCSVAVTKTYTRDPDKPRSLKLKIVTKTL